MMEIKEQVTCFLGICSSVDGTSEQAIKDWDTTFVKIIEIYNNTTFRDTYGACKYIFEASGNALRPLL